MSSSTLIPTTTYPKLVGKILNELRKSKNLEQIELANAVGVNQSTWSRIERGESALTIEQLVLTANELDVKPVDILRWADKAVEHFNNQGGDVKPTRSSLTEDNSLALIGAAALGILVAAIILKK